MNPEIADLERQVMELSQRLAKLRKETVLSAEIPDYTFETTTGSITLSALFAGKDILFAIHNMGQACRYCTLWADGLNGFVPHLEDKFALVLMSKDSPEIQQRMANSRGWRFRMVSHGGGAYDQEQTVTPGSPGMPGIACYQKIDGKIFRKGSAEFGPGDAFCSLWSILSLAGISEDDWTPQYSYWQRPDAEAMEDGGHDLCCG